ncbi:hypothetical protein CEXT_232351 [Caerostris extrusa]|uniref:Uncharacterized protein n=1 Tax=Caerostris extrusa TaxID=172846 RepID=A0AAV4N7U3_CAEEX|nr:hypothetical protein CEXT_232351 [Caerostris extrusa]
MSSLLMNSGNRTCEAKSIPSLPHSLRLSVPFDCVDLFNLQNSCQPETFLLNSVRADFLSGDESLFAEGEEQKWDIRIAVTGMKTYVKILENRIPDRDGCVREQKVFLVLECRE